MTVTAKFNRFTHRAFGGSALYACRICKKKTRETGEGESHAELCRRCYAISGQQNAHSDNGHAGRFADCVDCTTAINSYRITDWPANNRHWKEGS